MKKITLSLLITLLVSVIGAHAAEVVIKFKAPVAWEEVGVYTWGPELAGTWPGENITSTKDAEGFYTFTFDDTELPAEAGGVNIIFNNRDAESGAQQATDIYSKVNGCWEATTLTGTEYAVALTACPGTVTLDPIVVNFKAPITWSEVAVYAWEGESDTQLTGGWPGTVISQVGNYYTYTITNHAENTVKLKFNNNGNNAETYQLTADAGTTTCWDFDKLEETTGGVEYWSCILATCPTSGINDPAFEGWGIYPNPATDYIRFATPEGAVKATIYNSLGALVQEIIPSGDVEINMAGYASGVYYITVQLENGAKQSKVIVKQ